MIYLLYGSDTRRSREKLNEIIAEYHGKYGDLNVHKFDAEEDGEGEIKNALEASSLFSQKKLVVIRGLSKVPEKEAIFKTFEHLKDTIVVLWERELSKEEFAQILPYAVKVQEFKEALVRPIDDKAIFRLGDTFFTSPREGLRTLLGMLHEGRDDFNIFSYLANHARTLITVKHYSGSGKDVPPSHGIHPYVIKKAAALVRGLSQEKLAASIRQFFAEDHKIKTGISRPRDSLLSLLVGKTR